MTDTEMTPAELAANKMGQTLTTTMPASMVVALVVGNDDWWRLRVQTMCDLQGETFSELLLQLVTESNAKLFWVTEEMSVLGNNIDDNKLKSSITTQAAKVSARQAPPPNELEELTAQVQALTAQVQALTAQVADIQSEPAI